MYRKANERSVYERDGTVPFCYLRNSKAVESYQEVSSLIQILPNAHS